MTNEELILNQVRELTPTLDGWCSPERACDLARLVLERKPHVSLVIGTWGGRDTFPLALAHRANGFGRVVAIDPYLASASVSGQQAQADRDWWGNQQMHDNVCERFIGNTHRLGLQKWVEFQRTTSAAAVPPKEEIGLAVIDGNHGPESIADVEKWVPLMAKKAIIYADDLNWTGGAVLEAVKRIEAAGFVELFKRDTGAFFERK